MALGSLTACSETDELFPSNGTLGLSLTDSGITFQTVDPPGNQAMTWTVDAALVDVAGSGTFDFIASSECHQTHSNPNLVAFALQCGVLGFVLGTDTPVSTMVHLTISRMDIRRAQRIDIATGVDNDGDGVLNDGDGSGVVGDNPCPTGQALNCDDNCPLVDNAGQDDVNADGLGDVCSLADLSDLDGDLVIDIFDNCLWIANTGQEDLPDMVTGSPDGIGDACVEIADIVLPGGVLQLDLGLDFDLAAGAVSFLSLEFNDQVTLSCDPSFTSCSIDPAAIVLSLL